MVWWGAGKDAERFRETRGILHLPAKWHRSQRRQLGAKACQTQGAGPSQSSGRGEGCLPFISTLREPPLPPPACQGTCHEKGPHCGISAQSALAPRRDEESGRGQFREGSTLSECSHHHADCFGFGTQTESSVTMPAFV